MSMDFTKALGVHPEALKLRAERTRILAANIANESTPGFQARDVDFNATLKEHAAGAGAFDGIAGDIGAGGSSSDPMYRVPYHPSEDGNTVELSVEQASFSQNSSDFQTSLTFVNMQIKGLAKVIAGQ